MIQDNIPVINTQQMIEVDRLMTESYGISLIQMMENAGRNLALLAKRLLNNNVSDKKICIAIGSGNNGGGGLVAARHLSNWGAEVTVLMSSPYQLLKDIPQQQFDIVQHLPVSVVFAGRNCNYIDWELCDLVIDAIFGYGLNREPEGITAEIIQNINSNHSSVISLDSPSGLDATKGKISDVIIKANATLTLALPKSGLLKPEVQSYVGDLYIADISIPFVLYGQLGLNVPHIFNEDTVVPYKI